MRRERIDSRLPFGGRLEQGRPERSGMAYFEGFAANRCGEPGTRSPTRAEPIDHQLDTLAASYRRALARRAARVWQLEHDLSPVPTMERCRVWETMAVTLAEIMADSGRYSIDSTTVRAHVWAAGGRGDSSTRSWPLAGWVPQQASLLVRCPRTTVRVPPHRRRSRRLQGVRRAD